MVVEVVGDDDDVHNMVQMVSGVSAHNQILYKVDNMVEEDSNLHIEN